MGAPLVILMTIAFLTGLEMGTLIAKAKHHG